MKKLLSISLIFATFASFADCEKEIEEYGDGKHTKGFSDECIEKFKAQTPKNLSGQKTLEEMEVFAADGILIFEKKSDEKYKRDFIAGKMSELGKIKSFALNNKHLEILVVDEENQIKTYSSYVTGNVAPLRIIESVSGDVLNVAFIDETDEIAVQTKDYLYFFHHKANTSGHKPQDQFKRRVDLNQAYAKMLYDQSLKKVIFLDEEHKKAYSLGIKDQSTSALEGDILDIKSEGEKVTLVPAPAAL